jgi:hypothetical protein
MGAGGMVIVHAGQLVLGAVRPLHRLRGGAWHADDPDHQHQQVHRPLKSPLEHRAGSTFHVAHADPSKQLKM